MPYLPLSPLKGENMDLLTDEQVQDIDQFILRYTKLQDTMGTRLFTSILNYLFEPGLEMHIQRLSWVKNYQTFQATYDI
jgi:hypothetical protein